MTQLIIELNDDVYKYLVSAHKYDEHLDKRADYQLRFAVRDGHVLSNDATVQDIIDDVMSM